MTSRDMSPSALALLVCVGVGVVTGQPPDTDVVSTADRVNLPDGRMADVWRLADTDCELQQDTNTVPDGTTSNILKDFQLGKSALIVSDNAEDCYIRDIGQGELASHRATCRAGITKVKKEKLARGGARQYVEGEELAVSDVSQALADFCGQRRLVELQLVVSPPGKGRKPSAKRECIRTETTVCQDVLCCCQDVCDRYGWWTGRDKCKRWKTVCSTTERCEIVLKEIGC